ncbi:hypothetical protein XPA_001033 [Xanthoria parietina]
MPPHGPAWDARSTALGADHHGAPDPYQYRLDRNRRYPGVSHLLPGTQYFDDGYDASQGYEEYSKAREANTESRQAYHQRRREHRDSLNDLDHMQRNYYREHTGGATPVAHAELKPLARTWADDEAYHATAREAVYGHAPQMYGTRQGQTEHHRYIGDHYNNADHAENQYNQHAMYENDPTSLDRDCYGREVPHGYLPDPNPYSRRGPAAGHYSADLDPPAFAIKPAKRRGGKR